MPHQSHSDDLPSGPYKYRAMNDALRVAREILEGRTPVPSKDQALNDASRLAHASLTGVSPNPEEEGRVSIIRKWAIARAEVCCDDGVAWIAETRAGTGTWVIREQEADSEILEGRLFPWTDEVEKLRGQMLLFMTPEEREDMEMSDAVYQQLNFELHVDSEKRESLKRGS